MNRLRSAVAGIIIAGSAVLSTAAEKSESDPVSAAVDDLATAVEDAAAAVEKELSGPAKRKTGAQAAKKPVKEAGANGSKAAGAAESTKTTAGTAKDQPAVSATKPAGSASDVKAGKDATGTHSTSPGEPESAPSTKDQAPPSKAPDESAAEGGLPATEGQAGSTNAKAPPEPTEWPAVDIELAKARCVRVLKGLDAVTLPELPFRKGECGAPAPVRLVSVGRNPEIAVSPPALVTCDMVVALDKWVKENLQPLAQRHLGTRIIKIETMSDYSCRRAYGRAGNRLSEHAHANALDIRGFVTATGRTAYVLEEWGETQRDVAARLAAAQAALAEADTESAEANKKGDKPAPAAGGVMLRGPGGAVAAPGRTLAGLNVKTTIVEEVPARTAASAPRDMARASSVPALPQRKPPTLTRLGGPKDGAAPEPQASKATATPGPASKAAVQPPSSAPPALLKPVTKEGRFLREAHRAACRIFGTTLGPEANEAHRNHFHVDMAERKLSKVCE